MEEVEEGEEEMCRVSNLISPRVAGTVGDVRLRRAAAATRPATAEPSASTRTGGATCISAPLASPVSHCSTVQQYSTYVYVVQREPS